jgi:hypothetical protein
MCHLDEMCHLGKYYLVDMQLQLPNESGNFIVFN